MNSIEQISQSDIALKIAGWALFHYVSYYFFCRRMTDTDEYRHRNPYVFAGLMTVLPVTFLSITLYVPSFSPEMKILFVISLMGNVALWGFWFIEPTHPPGTFGNPIPWFMSFAIIGAVLSWVWLVASINSPELRTMPKDLEKNTSLYKVLASIFLVLMVLLFAYGAFKGWERRQ